MTYPGAAQLAGRSIDRLCCSSNLDCVHLASVHRSEMLCNRILVAQLMNFKKLPKIYSINNRLIEQATFFTEEKRENETFKIVYM